MEMRKLKNRETGHAPLENDDESKSGIEQRTLPLSERVPDADISEVLPAFVPGGFPPNPIPSVDHWKSRLFFPVPEDGVKTGARQDPRDFLFEFDSVENRGSEEEVPDSLSKSFL